MSAIAEKIYQQVQILPIDKQQKALDYIENLTQFNQPQISEKTQRLQQIMQQLASQNAFAKIDDPVAWQNEIRQDRQLPRE